MGLVRQQQELFFGKKYIGTEFKVAVDFAGIAGNFGITAFDLEKSDDPAGDLQMALSLKEPVLINVPINYSENVFPMVPPGSANKIMIDAQNKIN